MIKTIIDGIERVLRLAMTGLFALLLVPVSLQILARYIDFVPRYIWTEEVARFCFIWIIMLGSMLAVRHSTHFDVDLLPRGRSPRTRAASRMLVHAIMLIFSACFIYYGLEFADQGAMQTSEIAELPMLSIYIAWPVAGVVWVIFLLEKLGRDIAIIAGLTPEAEAE